MLNPFTSCSTAQVTDEPASCLKWGTRAAEQLISPMSFPSIHTQTSLLWSQLLIGVCSSLFHAPTQTTIKEPPTLLHFLPFPWYTTHPKKALAVAVWFMAQRACWFQKVGVKPWCSYFTFQPLPLHWTPGIVSFHFLKLLCAVNIHSKQKDRRARWWWEGSHCTSSKLPESFHLSCCTERGEALLLERKGLQPILTLYQALSIYLTDLLPFRLWRFFLKAAQKINNNSQIVFLLLLKH